MGESGGREDDSRERKFSLESRTVHQGFNASLAAVHKLGIDVQYGTRRWRLRRGSGGLHRNFSNAPLKFFVVEVDQTARSKRVSICEWGVRVDMVVGAVWYIVTRALW